MKRKYLILLAVLAAASCSDNGFESLNRQASAEYLCPVRPGTEGRNPFWNEFANKFIYAPAFDFQEVEGAVKYRFTVDYCGNKLVRSSRYYDTLTEDPEPHWVPVCGEPTGESWSFTADSPKADLSPIWNDITVGMVRLKVEGLDARGEVAGVAGEKEFLRDFPFQGPYTPNVRPYREAATMAIMYVLEDPPIKSWVTSAEPDMSYRLNTYPAKVVGFTIRMECLAVKLFPSLAEESLAAARNAAAFLMSQSKPEGSPLAFFPPTYYGNLITSSKPENVGKIMTMDPCFTGNGYADLYDATGEQIYLDWALGIADTYVGLQAEDGSMPIKIEFETGTPVNNCKAMLTPVMLYLSRLRDQYGIDRYDKTIAAAEKWMKETAMSSFDLTGQFEDMTVLNQKAYKNLTNCAAGPYARYLLGKDGKDESDIADAYDLMRFSEDQFIYWDELKNEFGTGCMSTPSVVEQYGYRVPIDNSTCEVANAFLDYYDLTGDRLWFEKAKALTDNLTVVQNAISGQIPTSLDVRGPAKNKIRGYWVNCTYASVMLLLRMAEYTENQ